MGPGYTARGLVADCQRWVNMYLEKTESGSDSSPGIPYAAYLTPGKQLLVTLGDAPVACVTQSNSSFYGSTVNLYYVVSGSTLYAITATFNVGTNLWEGAAEVIGTVDQKPLPAGQLFPAQIIVINPNLLFVVANGRAWVAAFGSAINTSVLNPSAGGGGIAYAVGDTGTVDVPGGGIPAQYIITGVDGAGAVTTYTLTTNGTGYSISVGGVYATTTPGGAQPGSGDGFTIQITAVSAAAWALQEQVIPRDTAGNYINSATWQDGYVIVSLAPNATDPLRRQFYISGLNDPTSWSALDFDTKEANSDPVIAVFSAYELLLVFGSQTTELWQDSGNVLSAFQRLPGGGVIEAGLASPWTVAKMDGTVCWLGTDARGEYIAWQLRGTTPIRISNHAIENAWSQFNVAGASAYSYVENGHFFYVLNFPIPDKTWVYDSTLGPALGWHEREYWDDTSAHADIGRYHGFFPEVGHCVGDYRNGNLYIQSLQFLQDNCAPIRRIRVAPHIVTDLRWNFVDLYRLHCLQGIVPSSGAGSQPTCTLEISDDGGQNYGAPIERPLGMVGQTKFVTEWRRNGRARDRVVRWTLTDPIDMVLVDLYAEIQPGSG